MVCVSLKRRGRTVRLNLRFKDRKTGCKKGVGSHERWWYGEMEVSRSNGNASPSSSPPTPPSPLPISYGPGQSNYLFSASPSPSPPFSPPSTSPHASSQTLPLLHKDAQLPPSSSLFSPFSLDRLRPDEEPESSPPSCLRELLEWLVQRCCNCCTNNSQTDSATQQLPKE